MLLLHTELSLFHTNTYNSIILYVDFDKYFCINDSKKCWNYCLFYYLSIHFSFEIVNNTIFIKLYLGGLTLTFNQQNILAYLKTCQGYQQNEFD